MADLEEDARLAALKRSGLLRQEPSARLIHVCYTVVELTDVDASQLNVLTDYQQLHIAEWPRVPARGPIDATKAGCREVVHANEVIAVPDTKLHPILCDFPWTEKWRGYLGAPVRYDGQVIGSLCGLAREPRDWSMRDRLAIATMADLAGHSIVYDQPAVPSEHG